MRVTITETFDFARCLDCPHKTNNSEVMFCSHPDAEDNGLIISHPECDNGFPDKCPLTKKSKETNKQGEPYARR